MCYPRPAIAGQSAIWAHAWSSLSNGDPIVGKRIASILHVVPGDSRRNYAGAYAGCACELSCYPGVTPI